jgi:hypothetical protein
MIDHLFSRIFTVADVGRWHGRTNYPSETDCVRLPLWRQAPPVPQSTAPAVASPGDARPAAALDQPAAAAPQPSREAQANAG